MKQRYLIWAASLGLLTIFLPQASAVSVNKSGVTQTDKTFANEAAKGLLRDMKIASIASQRGERRAMRQFADQVLAHRTKAHGQLRALAERTRLVLPDRLGAQQQMHVEQLEKLKGAALDRRFLQSITATDYLHFFALELDNGALQVDPSVKAFAKKQRAIIRGDMERADKSFGL